MVQHKLDQKASYTKYTHTSGVKWHGWWGKPKHWIWRRQNLNLIYVCEIGYNGFVFVFAFLLFGRVPDGGDARCPMSNALCTRAHAMQHNTIFIVQKLPGSLFYSAFEWHSEFNVNGALASWLNDSKAYFIVLTILSNEYIQIYRSVKHLYHVARSRWLFFKLNGSVQSIIWKQFQWLIHWSLSLEYFHIPALIILLWTEQYNNSRCWFLAYETNKLVLCENSWAQNCKDQLQTQSILLRPDEIWLKAQ